MYLIDADEAVKIIKRYDDRGLTLDEVTRITDGIAKEIEAMPTVDAEPVKHGKWIETKNGFHCSNCKGKPGQHPTKRGAFLSNFCPNCGAKMDGE